MTHDEITPYDKKDGKKEQVSTMFDNIAKYYDFLNGFLSLGIDNYWRRKAIEQLKMDNPKVVLDVATGTADLALEIEKALNAQKIVGVDISNEMLAIGRQKNSQEKSLGYHYLRNRRF
jgi:demethylmenaquinone methyltransferase/2-methoxy-6-polyprenyl-1,4-benzoquinol methylase